MRTMHGIAINRVSDGGFGVSAYRRASDYPSQTLRPGGRRIATAIQRCGTVVLDGMTHLPRFAAACDELLVDVDAVARLVFKFNPYQDHFNGLYLVQVNIGADWVGKEATINGETMSCAGLDALR